MTLTLNSLGQIWNFLYLSQKCSHCHKTKCKHIDWILGLKCDHQLWPWPWPWPWFFKVKYVISYISAQNGPIARKRKQTYRFNFRPQMWTSGLTLAMTLTLNSLGQIWNFLYLSQKCSHCHKTKCKHIDWILGLKCDHQLWPWPWPWPWFFKVKYVISYISAQNGPIARKRKQTYRFNFRPQMWTSGLTLAMTLTLNFQGQIWNSLYLNQKRSDYHGTKSQHSEWIPGLKCDQWVCNLGNDLDLWIFKVKCDLDLWPYAWCWLRIFMVKFLNSCISEWEGPVTLNKGGGTRSFMSMTVTIWWPRSGERISHIVTGVISDVGVPSTRLVYIC